MLSSLLLSGCVHYEVGIQFQDQTHGQIIQHINLGQRLTSFSGDVLNEWLRSIDRRVKRLDGKTKRVSNEEIVVTIPFYNGSDLADKFNQFFNANATTDPNLNLNETTALPQFSSQLTLQQNNWIFALRNHLNLDLDLRSLSLLSTPDEVLVSSGNLLELEFGLTTPWGAKILQSTAESSSTDLFSLVPKQEGKETIWTLKPGEINHLEAIFWVPSPIGIGTVIIIGIIYLGYNLRYKFLANIGTRTEIQKS